MDKLVLSGAARISGEPRLSITSVDRNLAGSNRSGKQRQLPDQAGTSESELLIIQLLAGSCLKQEQAPR